MEPPGAEDQQIDECSSEWSDFGEYIIGPEQFTDQAGEQPAATDPVEEQPAATEQAEDQPASSGQPQEQEVLRTPIDTGGGVHRWLEEEDLPADEEVEPVLQRPRRRSSSRFLNRR